MVFQAQECPTERIATSLILHRLTHSCLPLFLFVLTESKMRKYMTAGEQVSRIFAGQ